LPDVERGRSETEAHELAGAYDLLAEVEVELERVRASYAGIDPTDRMLFCVFFLFRAIRGVRAIRLLSVEGLAAEAATVLRSLLEDVVTLHFVLADFEPRFEKWAMHARVRNAYFADIARRVGKPDAETQRRLEQHVDALGGVPKGPARDRWDRGFASMARSVSETKGDAWFFNWFEILYAPMCDVAHGHSGPSIEYLASSRRDLRDDAKAVSYVLARTVMVIVGLSWGLKDAGLEVQSTGWAERAMALHDAVDSVPPA
jgi:hypothetical protein